MKLFRVWLLVLLAVLLPIRGAMAATMLCAPAAPSSAHHVDSHEHHGDHGGHGDHGSEQKAQDRCNLCSASCGTPPLPSASAGIGEPQALGETSFPDLSAPAPTFQSDGQERPPRTT